jgi:transposase
VRYRIEIVALFATGANLMKVGKINVSEAIRSVEQMMQEDASITPHVRMMFKILIVIINMFMEKMGINSRNSSMPPSRDPNRERGSKRKVKGEKRKPGGQDGHKGARLERQENPDKIEVLKIDRRTLPKGEYRSAGFEARQIIDIEISKVVTEYRAEVLEDEEGNRCVAEFPAGVKSDVQYGSSVKGHCVYLSQFQLLPYDRIRDYFANQGGIALSAGSVFNFNKEAFDRLAEFDILIRQHLIKQKLLHADETGINIGGKSLWLHTLCNDKFTLFFPHTDRGGEAMKDMGVLERFCGILCHDHWKPYFQFTCDHVLCNAHHLRELERAFEKEGQKWAVDMQELLLEINDATIKAEGCLKKGDAEVYRERYRDILTRADKECPLPAPLPGKKKRGRVARSKSRNLLERLRTFQDQVLRFMTDPIVPFTNNQGENDLRMTKVQQKISGCFRSFEGAQIFCRVRSYLLTCQKHGILPSEALRILFTGNIPDFFYKLE